MGFKINPFTGQIDIAGGASTAPTVQIPNYEYNFNNNTHWGSPSGGLYTITVPAGTHGKGTKPIVQILEKSGSDHILVYIAHKITVTGDVVIEVLETPDNRFEGRVLISENN